MRKKTLRLLCRSRRLHLATLAAFLTSVFILSATAWVSKTSLGQRAQGRRRDRDRRATSTWSGPRRWARGAMEWTTQEETKRSGTERVRYFFFDSHGPCYSSWRSKTPPSSSPCAFSSRWTCRVLWKTPEEWLGGKSTSCMSLMTAITGSHR